MTDAAKAATVTTTNTATANVEAPVTTTVTASDIIKRAGEMSKAAQSTANTATDVTIDDLKSQIKLDDIKDPIARSLAEKRIKELEAGFNKKYEQLANIRKEAEAKLTASRQWTPEELDRALKDPAFISLVQARQQQAAASQPPAGFEGSADEWSALNETEKQQFAQLTQKVTAQEQIMMKMLHAQEDEKLKTVYPDYDPTVVAPLFDAVTRGAVLPTREDIWKAVNYEKDIERAYQLGMQDRRSTITEKVNGSSNPAAHSVSASNEVPEEIKKKGFGAVGRWRLEQIKGAMGGRK